MKWFPAFRLIATIITTICTIANSVMDLVVAVKDLKGAKPVDPKREIIDGARPATGRINKSRGRGAIKP